MDANLGEFYVIWQDFPPVDEGNPEDGVDFVLLLHRLLDLGNAEVRVTIDELNGVVGRDARQTETELDHFYTFSL